VLVLQSPFNVFPSPVSNDMMSTSELRADAEVGVHSSPNIADARPTFSRSLTFTCGIPRSSVCLTDPCVSTRLVRASFRSNHAVLCWGQFLCAACRRHRLQIGLNGSMQETVHGLGMACLSCAPCATPTATNRFRSGPLQLHAGYAFLRTQDREAITMFGSKVACLPEGCQQ